MLPIPVIDYSEAEAECVLRFLAALMTNAFANYQPQISWSGHDNGTKQSANGAKAAAMAAAKITLPGSLRVTGKPALMGIPSRDSINTVKTKASDKTAMIRRGGL